MRTRAPEANGGSPPLVGHIFGSRGPKLCASGMLQGERPTEAAESFPFLEQTETQGSPQTGGLALLLLVSNPTALQRALGHLGTGPGPSPVQWHCLLSWLCQATAWPLAGAG